MDNLTLHRTQGLIVRNQTMILCHLDDVLFALGSKVDTKEARSSLAQSIKNSRELADMIRGFCDDYANRVKHLKEQGDSL